jgi:hypothetical protein
VGFPDGAEIVNVTASILMAVALVPYGMRMLANRVPQVALSYGLPQVPPLPAPEPGLRRAVRPYLRPVARPRPGRGRPYADSEAGAPQCLALACRSYNWEPFRELDLMAEPISGSMTATNALRAQFAQADQTAGRIARAGLAVASESGPDGLDAGQLVGDLVSLSASSHSITAATNALRTLDATLGELVHLLDRRA